MTWLKADGLTPRSTAALRNVERTMAFGEKPENGVTLPTVQGAHTLDLAIAVLGGFAELSALASTQFPQVQVGGKDGPITQARTTPDHLAVLARLGGGAPVAIEVVGGRPADATPFRFEIMGENGVLVLEGGAPRGVQSGVLRLLLDGKEQSLDARYRAGAEHRSQRRRRLRSPA